MSVTREEVAKIASLARIKMGDAELDTMVPELNNILDWVEQLGEVGKPWEIWKGDVDALFVGSKPGAMSGEGANTVGSTPVIATSPAAISSKALAVMRQNGTTAVAAVVPPVGPPLSWWPAAGR